MSHGTSAKDTLQPSSTQFQHWLECKTIFQKSVTFLMIRGVAPTSCQTQ